MADWDPFAVDEDSQAANAQKAPEKPGEVATTHITAGDLEAVGGKLFAELLHVEPWSKSPNPTPDLGWWVPSCTFEAWAHKDVSIQLSEGFVVLKFDKPDQNNVITESVMCALCDAAILLYRRPDLRMVIFTGEGKLFCGGKDPSADEMASKILSMPERERTAWQGLGDRARAQGAFGDGKEDLGKILHAKMWHTLAMVPQFTLSLVNGSVVGYGLGVLAVSDMVLSVKDAYYNVSDAKMGSVNPTIIPYLVEKCGISNVKCMFCTAENMTAEKARRIGLVQDVTADVEEAQKKIVDLAEVLTACGPRSVQAAKMLVCGVAGQQISEGVSFFTAAMLAMVTVSDEARDGMACLQARKPKPWEEKPIKPAF